MSTRSTTTILKRRRRRLTDAEVDALDTPLQRWLREKHACRKARRWVGRKTLQAAWASCPYSSWLWWVCAYAPRHPPFAWFLATPTAVRRRVPCPTIPGVE